MWGLFSGLGRILGIVNANDTAASLAKDISSGVDMLVYTDEEKAIRAGEAFTGWLKMVEMMKGSEQVRSVTRRILAVFIIFNLICMIWICVWVEMGTAFGLVSLPLEKIDGLSFTPVTWAVLRIAGIFQLGWVFCTIIVFYFGPHLLQFFGKNKA